MSEPIPQLFVNEIFKSLQGESSQAGRPCTFVRLRGCPLRCTWCDSEYAFYDGKAKTFAEIVESVRALGCNLVELTGGEPLAQRQAIPFLNYLVDAGFEVMLETSGALSIKEVPPPVRIIMDIKAPGSGEESKNLWENFSSLKKNFDEVKIVIKDRADFDYAVHKCAEHSLLENFIVLLSPVAGELSYAQLADWILESQLGFRFQVQLHKTVWPEKTRAF